MVKPQADESAWGDTLGTVFVLVLVAVLVGLWLVSELSRG